MGAATSTSTSAPASAAAETERLAAEMARLEQRRTQKLAEKGVLERSYETQLRELDRLKRSKASWRRDRQIRTSQAESQTTAERLSRADLELRAIDGLLRRQREAILVVVDREIALGPGAARRALLGQMRSQVTAALEPRVRKILVPDDRLDVLADPEELTEQIVLIRQAEQELRREREALQQREQRYAHMARLRELRQRAGEMSELDEDVVQHGGRTGTGGRNGATTGTNNGGGGDVASPGAGGNDSAPPPPPPTGSEGGSGNGSNGIQDNGGTYAPDTRGTGEDVGFERSSILLTDVVDASTIDALQRAGRSASPRARAEAAARARKQVEARLQQLEHGRVLIQSHLTRLRRGQ